MSAERGGLRGQWRLLAAVGAVATVGAFVGVRVAVARDGRVGSARSFVTVAGTLSNLPAGTTTATVTFEFQRREGAATAALCAQTVSATLGVGGAFSVPVPVATPESTCPDDIFDGRDVWVRALYGGGEVAAWAPVNPVPYAHFASTAGTAAVATQYGTPDCPVGYERDLSEASFVGDMRLCKRYRNSGIMRAVADEVVRVGTGASAFWIDRHESGVWTAVEEPRSGLFSSPTDRGELPPNGQWRTATRTTPPAYALNFSGGRVAVWITWFQALEACRASGKRLPTGEEWLAAAQGTPDPSFTTEGCVIGGGSPDLVMSRRSRCWSAWGAQDMIGNVMEWTADWYANVGQTTVTDATPTAPATSARAFERVRGLRVNDLRPWPPGFGDGDITRNVTAVVNNGGTHDIGVPAAVLRGGRAQDGNGAGIFAMDLGAGPSITDSTIGFRCVIPR